MSSYEVTPEEMAQAAHDVFNTNDEIQGVLSSLQSTCANVAGFWSGGAATAFQNLMERLDQGGQKINEALREIGDQLKGSGEEYARLEEEEAASMSSIDSRLNF
ncbi:WXG100 family type VII secretion target [Actinoalloteichus spitiensis]|uniref:WXG100 family type VII secretion target n=1 Tax=Actinoalloteichus spitiensis TaxID=252394 RepID=UPI0002ED1FAB|nr:WXG100 family type VII secretion target [Actinoalloteichus spitiensis]